MKRTTNQKRKIDNTPRHSRSDHGQASNNLYTPPIGKIGGRKREGKGAVSDDGGGGDSALLKRLEKITNEINTMQTYPNQNQPPNQSFHAQYHPQSMMSGGPPGFPPSYSNASPRPMDFFVGESPRQMNEVTNSGYQNTDVSPQHHHSPQKLPYGPSNMSVSNQMEHAEMTLNMKSLQTSLAEAHEEHRRAINRVELESNERRTLEQQNFDLNNKLLEARQAVKDTQAALQSAQFATDQLMNKRNQREEYIKELSEVNTTNISRIATLEAKLKEADNGLLEGNNRRDQFIHQIQSQLTAAQEAVYDAQSEINSLNGQKCQVETELENLRERHRATEQKLKDSEKSIELTYKAKINIMEEKNQSLMDKMAMEKHVYSQVQHLEEQLSHKAAALQRAVESSKNAEISLHETMGQLRSREDVILSKDSDIQQLETRIVKLENDVKRERQASSRCKVLEAEVSSKQTEIKMVNQTLNDKQVELDDTVSKIEQLQRDINDKNKDILDIDLKLKQAIKLNMSERGFNDIISSMQSEITDMEGCLQAERLAKKTAEEDAETFQIKIHALESTLKEKQNMIIDKDADIKNLQKIVTFDQVQANQVEQLENKVSEITHSLNVEIQSNRMSQRELEKRDIKIQGLEFTINTKDKTIQDLEDTVKTQNVSKVSDRIMSSTIQQLEAQLVERDGLISARNDKIKSIEKTLQDSLAKVRKLENELKDHASESQGTVFQKQNAEREAVKLKTTVQSLEGKLKLFEKQNETMESRTKLLIFEKHEAVNKLEMLEKIVQDMAESTIDSASSVKEQERLTEALNKANMQISTLSGDLEKSNITISMLRNSLAESDNEIKRLETDSHANYVAKKAVNVMVTNLREKEAQEIAQKEHTPIISRSNTVTTPMSMSTPVPKVVDRSDSVASHAKFDRSESMASQRGSGKGDTPPTVAMQELQATLNNIENANGITGRKHQKMSTLSEITDFINATAKDIDKISEKKKDMRESIERYTAEFKATHNRQPTASEKSSAPDNIFINYRQLSHILKKKSAKLAEAEEQFKKLKEEQGGSV